jgi:hypothetical protein
VKTDILSSGATSFLYIANANQHDSGNYTCALTDVADATISVHVLNGKCFRFLLAPPQIPGRIQSRKITQRRPASPYTAGAASRSS